MIKLIKIMCTSSTVKKGVIRKHGYNLAVGYNVCYSVISLFEFIYILNNVYFRNARLFISNLFMCFGFCFIN